MFDIECRMLNHHHLHAFNTTMRLNWWCSFCIFASIFNCLMCSAHHLFSLTKSFKLQLQLQLDTDPELNSTNKRKLSCSQANVSFSSYFRCNRCWKLIRMILFNDRFSLTWILNLVANSFDVYEFGWHFTLHNSLCSPCNCFTGFDNNQPERLPGLMTLTLLCKNFNAFWFRGGWEGGAVYGVWSPPKAKIIVFNRFLPWSGKSLYPIIDNFDIGLDRNSARSSNFFRGKSILHQTQLASGMTPSFWNEFWPPLEISNNVHLWFCFNECM